MKVRKENKFKLFWSKIKKPLMIISIIGNIIFILSLFVGCSNLKKTKVVKQEVTTQVVNAKRLLKRDNEERVTNLTNTSWLFKDDIPQQLTQTTYTLNYSMDTWLFTSIRYSQIYQNQCNVTLMLDKKSGSSGKNVWYLNSNDLYMQQTPFNGFNGNGWYQYTSQDGAPYYTINVTKLDSTPYITITGGTDVTNQSAIDFFYTYAYKDGVIPEPEPEPEPQEPIENLSIHLGDNFIPSVYICDNGQFVFNGFAGHHLNADTFTLILNGFEFKSNDTIFNTITLSYVSIGAGAPYVTQDGVNLLDTSELTDRNFMFCVGIKYQFRDANNTILQSVIVCTPKRTAIHNGDSLINAYDVRPPFLNWVNNSYRDLYIVSDSKTIISGNYLTIENKTAVELLQVTSNVSQEVMGVTNVFSLLGNAFNGLNNILSVNILPGISLGLLLFLPLIVLIIITIIRLVKK